MTALSLHLGLNFVDPNAYGGWDGELRGCHLDSYNMEGLARLNGWEVDDVLLDERATAIALDEKMREYAGVLEEGDRLLLTYSGHGGSVRDVSGDENDGRDESWCLWSSELLDDQIATMLARFRPGVRIVVVSDSCHSGTVTRARRSRRVAKLPDPEVGLVKASVLLFSGCTDEQLSGDLPVGGKFTTTMLECLRTLSPKAGWRTLHHQVVQAMPRDQTPRLDLSGIVDPEFIDERPFQV
ncbi:MAG: hypothetical protein K0R61_133 [Microvirga sp.]|jgi:hypothetical protein|nr:hypothetical protein [Microvirga sp.]